MFSFGDRRSKNIGKKSKNNKNIEPLQVRTRMAIHKTIMFRCPKRTLQIFSGNRGSATIEATLTIPIFIFAMLGILYMGRMLIVENEIYESMMNTGFELAEKSYVCELVRDGNRDIGELPKNIISNVAAYSIMKGRMEDNTYTSDLVLGGTDGVTLIGSEIMDEDDYINLRAFYVGKVSLPFIRTLSTVQILQVRQKAYTGYFYEDDKVVYVYVTENGTVYHNSRSCSHIKLSISQISKESLNKSYYNLIPCKLCGSEDNYNGQVYVTKEGDCYHYSKGCSGLKRTVKRVKLEDIEGLGECSRCKK